VYSICADNNRLDLILLLTNLRADIGIFPLSLEKHTFSSSFKVNRFIKKSEKKYLGKYGGHPTGPEKRDNKTTFAQ